MTALGRALKRAAVEDGRRRIFAAALPQPHQKTQVVDHVLEDAGTQPPLILLVNRFPRREVAGHHAPGGPGPHHPAQGVEHVAQIVLALGRVLRQQRQVRSHEGPLFVAHVTRVGLPCHA